MDRSESDYEAKKQGEVSSKTFLLMSLGTLFFSILLSMMASSSGRQLILPACYVTMGLFALFGFIQSFRLPTRKRFRFLNLAIFLFTSGIIYLMSIGFLGAIR